MLSNFVRQEIKIRQRYFMIAFCLHKFLTSYIGIQGIEQCHFEIQIHDEQNGKYFAGKFWFE